jgi:hypothetical protein
VFTWSWTAAPPGLVIDPVTGVVSGQPATAGSFDAVVTVTDTTNPARTATATVRFLIGAGTQTITFTSNPPTNPTVGDTYTVSATATSNLPVTFSVEPTGPNCIVTNASGDRDGHLHRGRPCVIDADQAGNSDWIPAPRQQQSQRPQRRWP